MLTENIKSGLVATYNYISKPKASQKGIFFISFSSSGIVGQSSLESTMPGDRGVVVGEQEVILKQFRKCS